MSLSISLNLDSLYGRMDVTEKPLKEAMAVVETTDALIQEMVRVAATECTPEAIILFGSHATGNAGPESDIDLLVVKSQPFDRGDERRQEMVRLWRALAQFPVPKDILVYSRDEVEKWRNSRNHVIARALREGRILYGSL